MAEPIIIVKEGSLSVTVLSKTRGRRPTKLLAITLPQNLRFPKGKKPVGNKGTTPQGKTSWTIRWK